MAVAARKKMPARRRTTPAVKSDFDEEGVRRTMLAVLESIYAKFPHITLAQYLVVLEVFVAETDGNPHTLASLVRKLGMPFSTASRVVWSLTSDGGEIGVLEFVPHPTDRRMKYLVAGNGAREVGLDGVLNRAMVGYYGETVRKLRHAAA